jgi:hypothetical protein
MTTIKEITAVGIRLEEAVKALSADADSPKNKYDLIEMLAVQILDSEFDNFDEGILAQYLLNYLTSKRLELGLSTDDLN